MFYFFSNQLYFQIDTTQIFAKLETCLDQSSSSTWLIAVTQNRHNAGSETPPVLDFPWFQKSTFQLHFLLKSIFLTQIIIVAAAHFQVNKYQARRII